MAQFDMLQSQFDSNACSSSVECFGGAIAQTSAVKQQVPTDTRY